MSGSRYPVTGIGMAKPPLNTKMGVAETTPGALGVA
jgi:hypothetical protein